MRIWVKSSDTERKIRFRCNRTGYTPSGLYWG